MAKIDREYFKWLTSQIEIPPTNRNSYNDLFARMHETEFVWHVPNDGNRVQDGRDLKYQFMNGRPRNAVFFKRFVSVLEVLIALSIRTAFTAGGPAEIWAWQLIENLELDRASDPLVGAKADKVDEILESLIWRTYQRDGQGGFFPLSSPVVPDQTKLEIWDQMNTYVNEIHQL